MACKPNEIAILKAASVKLDNDTLMILAYMYHTVDKESKRNGAKSFYRYEGRVVKISDLKAEVKDLIQDSKCLADWKWPSKAKDWDPNWFIGYNRENNNKRAAKWYMSKISKAMSWPDFMTLATTGAKKTAKGIKTSVGATYELDDYIDEDGNTFTIDTPENMCKLVGKCFTKKITLKRDLPKQ